MDLLFEWMDKLLPFEWANYDFMKLAFIAILFITPLFGMTGTMIVNNKMAFFSDALGHSALTGVAAGVLAGMTNTDISMLIFGILFALALNQIMRKNINGADTIISVFSSCSIAAGLIILSMSGNFGQYSGMLIGDILSITRKEILALALLLLAGFIFWLICFNMLNAISVNASLAKSKGIPVRLIENIFAVYISVVVMLSIKWIGILLINALLILPAASARNIAENMREYHFFSLVFALFSGVLGLVMSYYLETATGPFVVVIASILFFATYLYGKSQKN